MEAERRARVTPYEPTAPAKRPNLRMLRPDLDDLPPLEPVVAALPAGYGFRTYRPGDEGAWAAIMNTMNEGQPRQWDAAKTQEKLTGCPRPQFDPDGLFLITYGPEATPIGSACAWLPNPEEQEFGILHMVCVLPEHRGHRLGYPLCLAVLQRFRERGFRRVRLGTGEHRLGAVKIYLELGFQPVYRHPLHPEQWREIIRRLDWSQPLTPFVEEQ
ncbi:MAG: GNAT family N-acetyltransferase [Chloroflexi bacterium]|nr:GNAT family N-acetyltransferase [Chloroflexota bacterium]